MARFSSLLATSDLLLVVIRTDSDPSGNLFMVGSRDFCATLARDVTNSPLKLGETSEWLFLVSLKFII